MPGTLAIDLGSTTTVLAYQAGRQEPRLLSLPPYSLQDPCVVPTLLWLGADQGQPLIGRQVLEAGLADRQADQLYRDFKRLIGAGAAASAPQGLSPEAAGALLLRQLWRALPADLELDRLVLTAPIEAYRGYRQWLRQVWEDLPIAELALVDEPTAAAIGVGLPPGSRVLVVDVGGGTIDLSLVALPGGEGRAAPIAQLLRFAGRDLSASAQAPRTAEVIGKAGIRLGGRDIDRWIAAELCPDLPAEGELLRQAERLKCALSEAEEARQLLPLADGSVRELRLDRAGLEGLLRRRGLLEQLDLLLDQVLAAGRAAGLSLRDLAAVLPVGGGSRLAVIRPWLAQRCAGVPLLQSRPVEAVALGALALTPGVAVRDVLARGVSLRCWDQRSGRHHWHPLFMGGQPWPSPEPLELVLACSCDGQRQLELILGEPAHDSRAEVVFAAGMPVLRRREVGAAAVTPWASPPLALRLSQPGRQGQDCLRLRFRINRNGMLVVEGEELAGAVPGPSIAPLELGPVH
ncbi:MAG: Hsp70 family protein [Synechococcaceae cyanobacterium]